MSLTFCVASLHSQQGLFLYQHLTRLPHNKVTQSKTTICDILNFDVSRYLCRIDRSYDLVIQARCDARVDAPIVALSQRETPRGRSARGIMFE